jgi:hypothetical protein
MQSSRARAYSPCSFSQTPQLLSEIATVRDHFARVPLQGHLDARLRLLPLARLIENIGKVAQRLEVQVGRGLIRCQLQHLLQHPLRPR